MSDPVEDAFAEGFTGKAAPAPAGESAIIADGKMPATTHLDAAHKELVLTPSEHALYTMHLANLAKGGVPDGTDIQTLRAITVDPDGGGRTYVVPRVWDGKVLSPEEAFKRVDSLGWDKFPSYPSVDAATARYEEMHRFMERDTKDATSP